SVEQKIVDVNPSFVELSGYEKSELIGHHYQDLPLVSNQDELMLVIEKVESVGYIRNLELHSLTKSGEVRTVLISCELLVLDGKQHVISFIKDISARQAAQAAFRESEARFRSAFEDAGIGMALVAIDGQFIRVNKSLCEMLGYNENDLLNQTFLAIIHPEDLELSDSLLIKTLAGEISKFQTEKRYIHKQGNVIWGLLSVSLLRNINEQPIYFVVQIQDISERHEVERVKNEFISVVSHEVRTPLTSIKGALGILETGVLDDQPFEKQQMLQIAINNSDRLLDLVNDILELESLTSRQTKLNQQWFDVTTVVKQAIEDLQPIATNAGIYLKFNVPNIQIFADFRAILQTLTNLLGNAIKFSRPGGTVELSVSMSEEDILFTITDQGKGIPPEKLEAIFGRFQQVDVSDARQKGGTGLGLAISRGLVEEHQGKIWAESVLNSGSKFYFTIPRKYL
ncbi:PAS domain S-box protein, partial [Anabaenopsis sp. FSS-46]|uniref:PAS domain S-box protein n=1 Tax=Anabaenopsis sp. FSS-46 TaxID=2971766 RepID=UPI0024731080